MAELRISEIHVRPRWARGVRRAAAGAERSGRVDGAVLSQSQENCAASTSTVMNCSTCTRYLLSPVIICSTRAAAVERTEQEGGEDHPDRIEVGQHGDGNAVEAVAGREIVVEGAVLRRAPARRRRGRRCRRSASSPQIARRGTSMPP